MTWTRRGVVVILSVAARGVLVAPPKVQREDVAPHHQRGRGERRITIRPRIDTSAGPMRTAPNDDRNEPPGDPLRPVGGFRLRPLPVCEDPSFPVLHEYFEVVYGPLIGPTPLFLARTLARHVASAGGPVTVCPIELSREVGLRASSTEPLGKKSHLAKSLDRLAHHRLVNRIDVDTLGIVTAVPPATPKILGRLPESTRYRHAALLKRMTCPSTP